MLLGHYAVALAAKSYAPRASLGTLVLAAQLPDLIWPVLILLGWEHVAIVPGLMAASPFDFVHYPISHSLLTVALWAVVLSGGYFVFRRYARGAAVIAAAVVSHWLLDAPMHRPDLPLWPGSAIKVGFGLWNSIAATLIIEVTLFAAGIIIYTRATRPRDRLGTHALIAMLAFLLLIFASGFFVAPPRGEHVVAWAGVGLWLLVPWAAWIDRHREASRRHGMG
jgi:LexA-binding, inner membrane-associated putative hydrolase